MSTSLSYANSREPGIRRAGFYDDDTVDVTCWCEAHLVKVPLSEIKAGRTRSCDRKNCHSADVWCVKHGCFAVACCGNGVG